MSFGNQDDQCFDTVNVLVLVQSAVRGNEDKEFNYIRDHMQNPTYRAHVRDIGYIGSIQDYMEISRDGSLN